MPIERGIEDIDWCHKIHDVSGREIFFCKGIDCQAPKGGYTRIHGLNVHLMARHNKKATKTTRTAHEAIGNGERTSLPGGARRTRSINQNGIGSPKGNQYFPSITPRQKRRPQHNRAKRGTGETCATVAALVNLQKSLRTSLTALSRIIDKTQDKTKKKGRPCNVGDAAKSRKCNVGNVGGGPSERAPSEVDPTDRGPTERERNIAGGLPLVEYMSSPLPGSPEMERGRRQTGTLSQYKHVSLQSPNISRTASEYGERGTAYSPPSDAYIKSPMQYSRVDPDSLLITAFRSIREVIQIDDEGSPIHMYEVDRPSPFREGRGSSSGRPILVYDSPVKCKTPTRPHADSQIEKKPSKLPVPGSLNLKWDGHGKSTFLLPILGKKPSTVSAMASSPCRALLSPPSANELLNSGLESTGGSGLLHASPKSGGFSELLAMVDNLPSLHLESLGRETRGKHMLGLHDSVDTVTCPPSTDSIKCLMDEIEDSTIGGKQRSLVNYVSDTGSE